jgi:ParB family chromosome partitioning protein
MTRNALGRGLSALIREPETTPEEKTSPQVDVTVAGQETIQLIDIDRIEPSPVQPRSRFDNQALDDLAASIRANGVIQPLLLMPKGERFQLVAGERRWRAAQRAELRRVPAVVRNLMPEQALEVALVENLQREDLNPMEQASAFDRLIRQFHFTQEQIAEKTGKDRATVANALRLLKLESPIQEMLAAGSISAGHARTLLAIGDPALRLKLAKRAAAGALTVRQLERLTTRKRAAKVASTEPELDANARAAVEELQRVLGTRVYLRPKTPKHPGLVSIEYYDEPQLMSLYERLVSK